MKYVASLLVAAGILATGAATAKCSHSSTRNRFLGAETVVLVSIIAAHDGPVPWPYGLKKGASLAGRFLTLRVIRSWKGSLRPDDIVYGWTPSSRMEDAYPRTDVGTRIIVFYRKGSPHEIMACNAADPNRLNAVSQELDAIVRDKARLHS